MNSNSRFAAVFIVLSLGILAFGQSKERPLGSIKLVRCVGCDERIVAPPDLEYPRLVGYGPHKFSGEVGIQVTVDDQGIVTEARGVYGHPFFRTLLEGWLSALRFRPMPNDETLARKRVVMVYYVTAPTLAGKRTKIPDIISCGMCGQKAIYLPRPEYPEAARFVRLEGTVEVAIIVGTEGNVIEAKIISGHPFFHTNSLKAALGAKFSQKLIGGRPVKVATSIRLIFRR